MSSRVFRFRGLAPSRSCVRFPPVHHLYRPLLLVGLHLEEEAIWRLADGTFFEFMTGGKLPGDTNCTANRRVIRASSGKERR